MDLNKLSLGERIVAGAGILLFITLVALPWHSVDIDLCPFSETYTRRAIQSPNGFWGILAVLVTIAVVAAVLLRRLSNVNLPDLPMAWNQTIFFATIAILALLLLKLIIETDALGFGCYLAIILALGMTYGGYLISREPETAVGGTPTEPPAV